MISLKDLKYKKLILRLLLMIISTEFLTGCLEGKYDPNMTIAQQIKTRHYNGAGDTFGKGELLDEILEAVDTKDVSRLKILFSDYALANDTDIEDQINTLYANFPTVSEMKDRCCAMSGSHNQGSTEYWYQYQPMVDIYDENGARWRFIVIWIEGNSEEPVKQGLHSIQLISEEAYDNHNFTVHNRDAEPGVYVYVEE